MKLDRIEASEIRLDKVDRGVPAKSEGFAIDR